MLCVFVCRPELHGRPPNNVFVWCNDNFATRKRYRPIFFYSCLSALYCSAKCISLATWSEAPIPIDVPTDSQIDRQHFTQSIIICNCKDEWFSHGSLGASIGYLYVFFEHNNRLLGCAVTFLSGNLPFVARSVRFAIPYARLGHDSDAAVAVASAHFAVASQQFACLLHNCQVGKKSNNISTTTSMN